jgi:tRNA(Glu) U13 pseudouridine synthase TruD
LPRRTSQRPLIPSAGRELHATSLTPRAPRRRQASHDEDNWVSLHGDYRALLLRPQHLHWRYHEPAPGAAPAPAGSAGAPATTRAAAAAAAAPDPAADAPAAPADGSAAPEGGGDVTMQFDLPPGAYATMALREVMRMTPAPSLGHIRFTDEE